MALVIATLAPRNSGIVWRDRMSVIAATLNVSLRGTSSRAYITFQTILASWTPCFFVSQTGTHATTMDFVGKKIQGATNSRWLSSHRSLRRPTSLHAQVGMSAVVNYTVGTRLPEDC